MAKPKSGSALFDAQKKLVEDNPQLPKAFDKFVEQLKQYKSTVARQNKTTSTTQEARFVSR